MAPITPSGLHLLRVVHVRPLEIKSWRRPSETGHRFITDSSGTIKLRCHSTFFPSWSLPVCGPMDSIEADGDKHLLHFETVFARQQTTTPNVHDIRPSDCRYCCRSQRMIPQQYLLQRPLFISMCMAQGQLSAVANHPRGGRGTRDFRTLSVLASPESVCLEFYPRSCCRGR